MLRSDKADKAKLELTGYRIFRPKIIRIRDTPSRPSQWSGI